MVQSTKEDLVETTFSFIKLTARIQASSLTSLTVMLVRFEIMCQWPRGAGRVPGVVDMANALLSEYYASTSS